MSLSEITSRIHAAERKAGRPEGDTTLIAVSKLQPDDRVAAVLDEGPSHFSEKTGCRKLPASGRGSVRSYDGIELHIIGPLQTNKARQAMELADVIHTVDRSKLAKTLARLAQELGRCPDLFVQVNTGEEPQKAGILPSDADEFIKECNGLDLPVRGLMCIPPVDEEPALHFALLAKIAARNGLTGLSMGMSGDFETAIALGATHVRVGVSNLRSASCAAGVTACVRRSTACQS